MALLKNRIGIKYGKLLVIGYAGKNKNYMHTWNCQCDCGNNVIAIGNYLGNRRNSCGCTIGKNKIHGMHGTSTYKSWSGIIQRTTNQNNTSWEYYGGRGIKVWKRWRKFENFLNDMGVAPDGHTIERINNNGNYCKSNCKWVKQLDQARNKRNNIFIEHEGKKLCISEWAEIYGLKVGTLWKRIKSGYTPPQCFNPVWKLQQANNRIQDQVHR